MCAWSTSSGAVSFEIDAIHELQDLAVMRMKEWGLAKSRDAHQKGTPDLNSAADGAAPAEVSSAPAQEWSR